MAKGPYKILLTPSDFVFPQVADGLRVSKLPLFIRSELVTQKQLKIENN